ncbi:VOC family protein [Microterricola viridarii]|uniref:Glyoxalase superfamily enzyme, possibly 3-demethylubiquinone-9 3-methyltransferase n=1 Tax=Microterricola viridarii TaxID=412690 RepID=A0A1H1W7T4_9MICO|nr:VOC family protein [Microterricola viridarii]SDS92750.1 Glyoxalase superfamily enzyme, possibly 3-demethylubiquinone-9 3-methyltransferase [Microterricola viridarii]
MNSIKPCLWFDSQAEDAANFYVALFANARILTVSRYGEGGPMPAGTALAVEFELDGLSVQAINGAPAPGFSEAISLSVSAPTQADIDRLWDALTADGGAPGRCGWLTDKFGVSWQIVPPRLGELLSDPDPAKAGRAMQAMLTMTKLDIAVLEAAYNGE